MDLIPAVDPAPSSASAWPSGQLHVVTPALHFGSVSFLVGGACLRHGLMFRGRCMSCHTVDEYRSTRKLLKGRDRQAIGSLLEVLHTYAADSPYRSYMPPLVGIEAELAALGDYLAELTARPTAAVAFGGTQATVPMAHAARAEAPQ